MLLVHPFADNEMANRCVRFQILSKTSLFDSHKLKRDTLVRRKSKQRVFIQDHVHGQTVLYGAFCDDESEIGEQGRAVRRAHQRPVLKHVSFHERWPQDRTLGNHVFVLFPSNELQTLQVAIGTHNQFFKVNAVKSTVRGDTTIQSWSNGRTPFLSNCRTASTPCCAQ